MDFDHLWILLYKPLILGLRNNPRTTNGKLRFRAPVNFVEQTSDSYLYSADNSLHALALHA